MNNDLPIVSIVIVTYNALDFLKSCIESIKKYTQLHYELIIVDNNSNTETKGYLKKLSNEQNIKVIFNNENRGYGPANNQAIEMVNSDYVCLLNSDTIVSPNWLNNLIQPLLDDEKIGITLPVSNCTSAKDIKTGENLFSKWEGAKFFIDDITKVEALNLFYDGYLKYVDMINQQIGLQYIDFPGWAGTWCAVFKYKILAEVGGLFDEKYEIDYCEDVDFSWRVLKKDYKIVEVQNSFVHHYGNASFDLSEFDKHDLDQKNKVKLLEQYELEIKKYIEENGGKDKYDFAYLSYQQSIVKSYVKYIIAKRHGLI